jgi:hypothetical protein
MNEQNLPLSAENYLKIDTLIKAGKWEEASLSLDDPKSRLSLKPVQCAELFRRLGDYGSALQVLRSILFLQNDFNRAADAAAILEYCLSLAQFGLYGQAKQWMQFVQNKTFAWHQLGGFIALKELHYRDALHFFQAAEKTNGSTPYQVLVARVNVANSLLGTFQYPEAMVHSQHTESLMEADQQVFLRLYLKHIQSQAHAFLKNKNGYEQCTQMLFEHLNPLDDLKTISADTFEFLRGRFVSECVLGLEHAIPLRDLVLAASRLHEYHALTELKVMSQVGRSDCTHLKFNLLNPTGAYLKKRIEFLLGEKLAVSEKITLTHLNFRSQVKKAEISCKNKSTLSVYDLQKNRGAIKVGQLPHRLISLFIHSPDKKFTVNEIYQALYPEKIHFHPSRSANLVHQAVKRLNKNLTLSIFPATIQSSTDRYMLVPKQAFKVVLHRELENQLPFLMQLSAHFRGKEFRSIDLAHKLNLKPRQIQNLLLQHSQFLSQKKVGRHVFYRVASGDF